MPIPALLVTGATGAGKTTHLSRLLSSRPRAGRWAVLVNDFGAARLADDPDVLVREVAGCICCSSRVSLRTALIALLRERPQRLFIEASGAAHPQSIIDVLREPGLASAVTLERTVCVVNPAQAVDPRYAGLELYREQMGAADAVLLAERGGESAATLRTARQTLQRFGAARIESAAL
jgi:G3E family GTPase